MIIIVKEINIVSDKRNNILMSKTEVIEFIFIY